MTSNMKNKMITTFHYEDIAGKQPHRVHRVIFATLLHLQAAVAGTTTEAVLGCIIGVVLPMRTKYSHNYLVATTE